MGKPNHQSLSRLSDTFGLTLKLVCPLSFLLHHTITAQETSFIGNQVRVGHFLVTVPPGWNSFSDSDKAGVRRDFSTDLAPGLKQYVKAGEVRPHMGEFEILQKPPAGQLIGWTLVIPDQVEFLKEILKQEDVQFEKGKSLSGGRVTGGSCRLVNLNGFDVVRVDVEMANGGKSTNLQFWSPKDPGVVSTLMIGLRLNSSAQTEKEFEDIISSLAVTDKLKN